MEFMPLHVVRPVVNPISIMVGFPMLALRWDQPLPAVPGATVTGLIAMEAHYLLTGAPVSAPDIGTRAILMLTSCTLLWAVNAGARCGQRCGPEAA